MVFHYLQIFLRNLRRLKGYSFISIFGLSAGLTVCMFILLYIRYEISFDSHHKDGERIYRIKATVEGPTFTNTHAGLSPIFAGLIKGKFPQIENITWTWTKNVDSQVECGDKILKEDSDHVVFVDEEFLNVFTVKFMLGNPSTVFVERLKPTGDE
jgi:putative ABC transport system permease protein